jgi:hypothetical protein
MAALFALMFAAATAAAPEPSTAAGTTPPTAAQAGPGPSVQQEYEEKYIWAEDFPVVYGGHHYVGTTIGTFFFQGKYRKPLAGADLYDAIGRPDLATTYRNRLTRRYVLLGAGLALVVGGGVYALSNVSTAAPDVSLPPAEFARQAQAAQDASRQAMTTGAVISTGGLVLGIIAALLGVDPLDASEVRRLVDEYDRRLEEKLGPGAGDPEEHAPKVERSSFSFGVAPGQGGALASLAITF